MDEELEAILANGTDEEIEAALAGLDIDGDMLFGDEDGEAAPAVEIKQEAPAAEPKQESKPTETDVEAAPSAEEGKQGDVPEGYVEIDGKYYVEATDVSSKNGQHSLPYEVLAQARERATAAEAERERLAKEKAELESQFAETKRVAELHSTQLKEAGMDPRKLPGEMLKDPELMNRIKDEYPELGELVSELANQMQQYGTKAQPEPQAPAQDDVQAAFDQSQHLKQWRTNDADKWDMAQVIDSKLANDPSFASKTVAERFKEVEKRVQSAFGEQHKPKPSDSTAAPIPNTPTDIGSQANDLNSQANLLDKDAGTITAEMASMTEAQVEALLESASDFL